MALAAVLFPHPDSPASPKISPAPMRKRDPVHRAHGAVLALVFDAQVFDLENGGLLVRRQRVWVLIVLPPGTAWCGDGAWYAASGCSLRRPRS